jgi:hypothetical protein
MPDTNSVRPNRQCHGEFTRLIGSLLASEILSFDENRSIDYTRVLPIYDYATDLDIRFSAHTHVVRCTSCDDASQNQQRSEITA